MACLNSPFENVLEWWCVGCGSKYPMGRTLVSTRTVALLALRSGYADKIFLRIVCSMMPNWYLNTSRSVNHMETRHDVMIVLRLYGNQTSAVTQRLRTLSRLYYDQTLLLAISRSEADESIAYGNGMSIWSIGECTGVVVCRLWIQILYGQNPCFYPNSCSSCSQVRLC